MKDHKPLLFIPLVLLALTGLHFVFKQPVYHFYLNVSDSEPIGLYQAIASGEENAKLRRGQLTYGDYVLFTPPPNAWPYVYGRGWLSRGCLLLKNVAALPGDQARITERAIFINNRYLGPIKKRDRAGLPLPKLRGPIVIPAKHFLPLATRIPNSFDGRYFGPVSIARVKHVVRPVLVWR